MPKKKTKKFKSQKKELAHNTAAITSKINDQELIKSIDEKKAEKKQDPYKTDEYKHVQKDVKKILLIILGILILLAVAYIVSIQTKLFTDFGNWIYKILNIQTTQ